MTASGQFSHSYSHRSISLSANIASLITRVCSILFFRINTIYRKGKLARLFSLFSIQHPLLYYNTQLHLDFEIDQYLLFL